jgi:hypothetical protein
MSFVVESGQISCEVSLLANQERQPMLLRLALALGMSLGVSAAYACDSGHWVDSVAADGQIVILEDGSVWQIEAGDEINTALWLPTTDITVCAGRLINTDDEEVAGAYRVR